MRRPALPADWESEAAGAEPSCLRATSSHLATRAAAARILGGGARGEMWRLRPGQLRGRPSDRVAMMLRWISLVPPPIVQATAPT